MSAPYVPGLDRLAEGIAALDSALPGRLGALVRYLEPDLEVAHHADDLFPTASVIKVPIMAEVFRQAVAGTLLLDEPLPLHAGAITTGSGLLQFLHPGLDLTIRDSLELMIAISDNTAANLLLARVGTDAVNAMMAALGLAATRCSGPIGRPNAPSQLPLISRTTPRESAWLLEQIARERLVSPGASREMARILGHQVYEDMLPRHLPLCEDPTETEQPCLVVQHKTGSLDHVRNGVGIVRVRDGENIHTIVISAFTADLDDGNLWTIENVGVRTIAALSRLAYDALPLSTA